ncbi:type II toxin-antitoxin system VapC family toxin [Candidatus Woesearchaeota archaeon]|nr:type II toxin-antitoxin system VapC family toxin [Candidatus Woesearchaeota archaeon]
MKYKAFLDTAVFIYSFEFPDSNSNTVLWLVNKGILEAIISERVFLECIRYFEKHHTAKLAKIFRKYLLESCVIIPSQQVSDEMTWLKGRIKDKDLEQLATVRRLGLKFLISYDRDFLEIKEYATPKRFLMEIGVKAKETEY